MPKNKSPKIKETEIAICVKGVSKTFRIPHEKISSVKGAVLSAFKSKSYEEFQALDDVSFEVKKGEFFGIIGRNGSGKSTLLKVLAGIYQADKGKVEINGMISPFLELGIGFNPELSGRDNVYLNATVLGMTKKQIDEKFNSIVKFSELERFIDQKLKNYSSGMQVRLAFSVSIHANRDILLMDEVLAVGDSNFQSKCLEEFNKYRDMGRTVLIVTHDISVVERYCKRAMLLRNGRIVKIGKAREVTDEYVQGNMEDEEERISGSWKNTMSKKEYEHRRVARIEKVEIFDKNEKIVNAIKTHDKIEVRVYLDVAKDFRDEINLGISFETGEGQYLFGYSTEMDVFVLGNKIKYVSLIIDELLLLRGVYAVNATIVKKNSGALIESRPRIKKINIFSSGREHSYKGFLSLGHSWKQK